MKNNMVWILFAIYAIGYIVALWWTIQKERCTKDVTASDLASLSLFSLASWLMVIVLVLECLFDNPKVVFKKKELGGQDTKIYIDIRGGISPAVALKCVESVVEDDESYHPTEFDTAEGKVWVSTCLYNNHDCYIVSRTKY